VGIGVLLYAVDVSALIVIFSVTLLSCIFSEVMQAVYAVNSLWLTSVKI